MNDLKRIDPEAVKALYRKHGLLPVQHDYLGGTCGCCINTILAVEAAGRERAVYTAAALESYPHARALAKLSGLDPLYAMGLAKGWDDFYEVPEGGAQLAGYADGATAWEACKTLLESAS